MSKHLRVNGGFTLIEMLIVVIILGLISAYVTQHISKIDPKAKEVTLKHNLRSMRKAIDLYQSQHESYPGAKDSKATTCPDGGKAGTG